MSMPEHPNQTLSLVQPGVQSDYFIKTKFSGEISIELYEAFRSYRIHGRLPGANRVFLARALHNIPLEMSIEESLGAIPFTLLFDSFCVITSFKLLETLSEA
jgi:hypothetical protein